MSKESDRINAKHNQLLKARQKPNAIIAEMLSELRSHLESAQLLAIILSSEASSTQERDNLRCTAQNIYAARQIGGFK